MKHRYRIMMVTLLLSGVIDVSVSGLWAGMDHHVGTLTAIREPVEILHSGAAAFRPAELYEGILEKDRIRTGPGARAKILYDDDTLTILSENSSIEIQQYALSETKERIRSLIGLNEGKLRLIVSKHPMGKECNFYVQTPTAIVGVRGHDSVVVLDADKTTTAYHLSGELEVSHQRTSQRSFIDSGEFLKVFPDGRQQKGTITTEMMEKILGFFADALPSPEIVKDQIRRVEQKLQHRDADVTSPAPGPGSAKSEDPG